MLQVKSGETCAQRLRIVVVKMINIDTYTQCLIVTLSVAEAKISGKVSVTARLCSSIETPKAVSRHWIATGKKLCQVLTLVHDLQLGKYDRKLKPY